MAKKKKVEKRRKEQRFFPQSNANPWIVRVIGALGAIALGAGAYEQFLATAPEPWKYTPYVLAAGAHIQGVLRNRARSEVVAGRDAELRTRFPRRPSLFLGHLVDRVPLALVPLPAVQVLPQHCPPSLVRTITAPGCRRCR